MKIANSFLFLLFAVTFSGFAEEAKKLYKWIDKQGNVHFSDQPRNGAEEIKMKLAPSTKMQQADLTKLNSDNDLLDKVEGTIQYESLEFSSPLNDGVVRNNDSSVTLSAHLSPGLADGHVIRFFLDGMPVPSGNGSASGLAKNLAYGPHSASIIVVDPTGKVLISSKTIHFQLQHQINPAIRKKQKAAQGNN